MPPLSTDYVFMSYSRRDDAVMRRIVAFLREQGIKVWVDNEKLIPGTPVWEKEIEKAVQGASAVVVVLSPDSKDSEWVRREISLADQYEKRVFPLLVRGDEKTSISIRLIGRQYVDIRSNEEAGLNYVSATLLRYLEEVNEREQNAKKEADRLAAQKIKAEKRLAARKAEEERIALERVMADRKAKEEADRLSAQKAEEDRTALEKIASDRKAKEDADRLIAQKAKEERIALEKVESDRKAKEDADHLIAQKAEEERIANEKAEADRKAKEEADRLAAQKIEQERIALEKVAADRKAKEDADCLSAQKVELDSKEKLARENAEREAREKLAREKLERELREKAKVESIVQKPVVTKPETKKQSGTKFPFWGIGLIAFAVLALIVWGLSSLPASPNVIPTSAATQTLFVRDTPTLFVEPATETLVPTSVPQPTETPIPTPALGIGSTEISPKDGMTLLYVPAGEFIMGSDIKSDDFYGVLFSTYTIYLDAYWIDQTEVTNKMFSAFINATGYQTDAEKAGSSTLYGSTNYVKVIGADWQHPTGPKSDISGKENHPVIHVSWNDAVAYCKWIGGRLPTEAEWEKAARGADGRAYPWGNDAPNDTLLNYNRNVGDTTEVGEYPDGRSIYGAYDMAGNVGEWVSSLYEFYPYAASDGRENMNSSNARVVRGSSWDYPDKYVRSAHRDYTGPLNASNIIGFRCARGISP